MDVGTVGIATPLHEKRIASIHRGAGPKGAKEVKWQSFDHHLQKLAMAKGANLIQGRVEDISLEDGHPRLKVKGGVEETYDLLAVATGVNTGTLKIFEALPIQYTAPTTTGTYIREFYLGMEKVEKHFGTSMHVFLLNIPRLEFAALVPKGEYVSLCLLGRDIDDTLVRAFLDSSEVRSCFSADWQMPQTFCHCSPRICLSASPKPYADRIVFIGDCGATRLYKDGIGAAYKTAKSAATTAVLEGVSEECFRRHYRPVCGEIERDNMLGKLIFLVTREIQRRQFERRGVLRMVDKEQKNLLPHQRMSTVLWDTFTGSAPYREILVRTLHPGFLLRFGWEIFSGLFATNSAPARRDGPTHAQ
jgi:flavin-dependent dehydrogenase